MRGFAVVALGVPGISPGKVVCEDYGRTCWREQNGAVGSAINLTAVAHAVDAHDANLVSNLLNDAVVAHADAPVVLATGEFAAAWWARVVPERLNRRDDALVDLRRESREVFFRTAFKQDAIHGHLRFRSPR